MRVFCLGIYKLASLTLSSKNKLVCGFWHFPTNERTKKKSRQIRSRCIACDTHSLRFSSRCSSSANRIYIFWLNLTGKAIGRAKSQLIQNNSFGMTTLLVCECVRRMPWQKCGFMSNERRFTLCAPFRIWRMIEHRSWKMCAWKRVSHLRKLNFFDRKATATRKKNWIGKCTYL